MATSDTTLAALLSGSLGSPQQDPALLGLMPKLQLAQAMINEGIRNVTAGANPMLIRIGIEKAVAAERERCIAIIQRARLGEIDQDFRSIISRIKCGMPANED